MAPPGPEHPEIGELRRRAAAQRQRAARAAALALEYAARAEQGPERLRRVYARLAELHRQIEARHLGAARLQEAYAASAGRRADRPWTAPPMVMEAVAAALGIPGATAVLYGRSREAVLVAASDATARAAHDLEAALGEGAAAAAMAGGRRVHAAGRELPARWPRYGPAVGQLGIHAVIAAPLQLPAGHVGALCCYHSRPAAGGDMAAAAGDIAAALTPILLRSAPAASLPVLMDAVGLHVPAMSADL